MRTTIHAANDDPGIAAITYGPVVLAGDYGDRHLSAPPALTTSSITRTSVDSLAFTATADESTVALIPFHGAHDLNYTVYWDIGG